MSRQELEQLTRYIQQTQGSRAASVEAARKQLQQEGVITPDGKLTRPYGGEEVA